MLRIHSTSVLVDDQAKALAFYTDVLGFQLQHDVSLGEYRWLTVVSPLQPTGTQLLLEPDAHSKRRRGAASQPGSAVLRARTAARPVQ